MMKKIILLICICFCNISSVFADSISEYYLKNSLATICVSTKEARNFFINSRNTKFIDAYKAVSGSIKKHYNVDLENITHFGAFILPSFREISFMGFVTGKLPDIKDWTLVIKAFEEDKKSFDENSEKFDMQLGDETISLIAYKEFVFWPVSNELMFIAKANVFEQIKHQKLTFSNASENFVNLMKAGNSFFIANKTWLSLLDNINEHALFNYSKNEGYIAWLKECLGNINKVDFVDFSVVGDNAILKINLENSADVESIKKGIEKKLKETDQKNKESFERFCETNSEYDYLFFANRIYNFLLKWKSKSLLEDIKIDYGQNSVSFTYNYSKHMKQIEFFIAVYHYITTMFESIDSQARTLCYENQLAIILAVKQYNEEHDIAMSVVNVPLLRKMGYLKVPIEKNQCEWVLFRDLELSGYDENFSITCLKHGRKPKGDYEYISTRDILAQYDCYKNQKKLQSALFKYNKANSEKMQDLDMTKLLDNGYLDKEVVKPEKGCDYFINHKVGENGSIQCKKHALWLDVGRILRKKREGTEYSEEWKCFKEQRKLKEAVDKYNSEHTVPMVKLDYYVLGEENYIEDRWRYMAKLSFVCDYICEGNLASGGYIYCRDHGSAFNNLKSPEPRKDEDIEYSEPEITVFAEEKLPKPILLNAKEKAIAFAKKLYANLPNDWEKLEYKASDGTIHFLLMYKQERNIINGRIKDGEFFLDEITADASFITRKILGEPVIGMSKSMIDFLVGCKEAESKNYGDIVDYMYEVDFMKGYHTEFFVSSNDKVIMWCIELKPEYQCKIDASLAKIGLLKESLYKYHLITGRFPHLGADERKYDSSAYNAEEVLNWTDKEKNVLTSNTYDPGFEIKNYSRRYRDTIEAGNPSKFMCDGWKNNIQYIAEGRDLYLWSYGPDGKPAGKTVAEAQNNPDSDDMIFSIYTFKEPLD